MKDSLYKRLLRYVNDNYIPMHMPGAKRNSNLIDMPNPYSLDITEIDGFDNLHNADDILRDEMERVARLYGADDSLLLVNGSSAGVIASVSGVCEEGDKVLISRNCHISVYNALISRKLEPVFIYPDLYDEKCGIVDAVFTDENIFINNPGIKAVVITSPTYEGIVSDISAIADIAHRYGAVLIVDEAHGAHFPFSNLFPESSVTKGADIVITSLHKTLPAFTSSALMLFKKTYNVNNAVIKPECIVNGTKDPAIKDLFSQQEENIPKNNTSESTCGFHGENNTSTENYKYRFNIERVKYFWNFLQTTSPSYLLMGSISACFDLIEEKGEKLFKEYTDRLVGMRRRLVNLKNIRLLTCTMDYEFDINNKSENIYFDNNNFLNTDSVNLYHENKCSVKTDSDNLHSGNKYFENMHYENSYPENEDFPEVIRDKKILSFERYDMSKIVLICADGKYLYDILLKEYGIQLEMSSCGYVIAMTGIGDTDEYYERFCNALEEIDNKMNAYKCGENMEIHNEMVRKSTAMLPSAAADMFLRGDFELIDINDAAGRTACENVCCYPPGIPEIIPGEIWNNQGIDNIVTAVCRGLEVLGVYIFDDSGDGRKICVKVLKR